jgi:menaquinone-dependent protoporphyrinogen oxidase
MSGDRRILIAVASKHGSTQGIAEAIAGELRIRGFSVDVRNAGDDVEVAGYAAAIVGSAVYMGNWLAEGRKFVRRHQAQLTGIPVWLFSSGPVGPEPQTLTDPNHLDELVRLCQARGHQVFVGKLDRNTLGFGERLVTRVVHAHVGDFRDWAAIRTWADGIAGALAAEPSARSTAPAA